MRGKKTLRQWNVKMRLQNPLDLQGASVTWRWLSDDAALTPSTCDLKTWTTASAGVTPTGCFCCLKLKTSCRICLNHWLLIWLIIRNISNTQWQYDIVDGYWHSVYWIDNSRQQIASELLFSCWFQNCFPTQKLYEHIKAQLNNANGIVLGFPGIAGKFVGSLMLH